MYIYNIYTYTHTHTHIDTYIYNIYIYKFMRRKYVLKWRLDCSSY